MNVVNILYFTLEAVKRVDLKIPHHTHTHTHITMWGDGCDVFTNLSVVIVSQYIHNHSSLHTTLNLHSVICQFYFNQAWKINTAKLAFWRYNLEELYSNRPVSLFHVSGLLLQVIQWEWWGVRGRQNTRVLDFTEVLMATI